MRTDELTVLYVTADSAAEPPVPKKPRFGGPLRLLRASDADAAEVLAASSIDVVLFEPVDPVDMPVSLGTLEPHASEVPVVYVTSREASDRHMEVLQAGAQSVVIRGVDRPTTVERTLRHAVERHRLRRMATVEAEQRMEVLATISHELRNSVHGLLGLLGALEPSFETSESAGILRDMQAVGKQVTGIADDLLDFAKLRAGHTLLRPRPCKVRDVVEQAVCTAATRVAGRALDVVAVVSSDVDLEVEVDGGRLGQVLVNLAVNAVRFTERGVVEVGARRQGDDSIQFFVRDTGVGIAEEDLERIMRPFEQAASSFVTSEPGSGLGLMVARRLIDALGGSLTIDSVQHVGSTFSFDLSLPTLAPVERALEGRSVALTMRSGPGAAAVEAQLYGAGARIVYLGSDEDTFLDVDAVVTDEPRMANALAGLAGPRVVVMSRLDELVANRRVLNGSPVVRLLPMPCTSASLVDALTPVDESHPIEDTRVLVVDDNPVCASVTARALRQRGFLPDTAHGGRDALARIRASEYGIVLMDCRMPDLDGFETTRELRSFEAEQGRPQMLVLGLTAEEGPNVEEDCLDAGMDGVLRKPIGGPTLVDALRERLMMDLRCV